MYGLNAVALVLFGCINMLAYRLCRCPEGKRKKVVYVLLLVLFLVVTARGFFRCSRRQYRKFDALRGK